MKYFFLSTLIALSPIISLYGQTADVAALQAALKKAKSRQRVDVLDELCAKLAETQPVLAKEYAEEAYQLSKKEDYPQGAIASVYHLGVEELKEHNFSKAARYITYGSEAARSAGDQLAELRGLELLQATYRAGGRRKKLAEAELAYRKLKNSLDLKTRTAQLAELKEEYRSKEEALQQSEAEIEQVELAKKKVERVLSMTVEEKLRQEAELARIAREKAELEVKTLQLENQTVTNALEISEKEKEILEYDALLKRQQFWLSLALLGLIATIAIIALLVRNYKLKKARSEEKSRMQNQLLLQEKMATLGQLTAGIAHEIKNPLNFVNNFAEGSTQLAEELMETIAENRGQFDEGLYTSVEELVEEVKQNASDIVEHGKRADRIVNSMMEHARGEKGEARMVNINTLLKDNLQLAYHGYRAHEPGFNVDIRMDLDESLPMVSIIPQDLSRALLNVFNNACYAANQKRKEKGHAYKPAIQATTRPVDGGVEIRIRDNGPGIPPEIRRRIFEPFFTTKPTGEGNTGLGLSISYDIVVQRHQGKFEVESETGKYTEMVIRLPA